MRRALVSMFAMLVASATLLGLPAALAEEGPATLILERSSTAPGESIVVQLAGWPSGAVTLSVCGNAAQRGDIDCNLIASQAVGIQLDGVTRRDFSIDAPPVPCPCVVRAHNAANAIVRTVALQLAGVGTAPLVAPDPASVEVLRLTAEVHEPDASGWGGARARLGGPTPRVLRLTLTNSGAAQVSGLTMTAAVGRDNQRGEPLRIPALAPLAPGESRSYELPFTLSSPAFGSYVVFGTVYGPGAPSTFEVATSGDSTLLLLLGGLLVLDVGTFLVLRLRQRRAARRPVPVRALPPPRPLALPAGQPPLSTRPTLSEHRPDPGSLQGVQPSRSDTIRA